MATNEIVGACESTERYIIGGMVFIILALLSYFGAYAWFHSRIKKDCSPAATFGNAAAGWLFFTAIFAFVTLSCTGYWIVFKQMSGPAPSDNWLVWAGVSILAIVLIVLYKLSYKRREV